MNQNQFTYVCKAADTHIVCVNGNNIQVTERDASSYEKEHGKYLIIGGVYVYQTLHVKCDSIRHLASIVYAVELARFIFDHYGKLINLPSDAS